MTLKEWVNEAFEVDKLAIEAEFEELMKQGEVQHKLRMDSYAEMRNRALERLAERYGITAED